MLFLLMSVPPDSNTKFDLAWMIMWIILSAVLMALVAVRKLTVPNLVTGLPLFAYLFAVLELVIWVFLLAALAADQWSMGSTAGHTLYLGVVNFRRSDGSNVISYNSEQSFVCPPGSDQDWKNLCGTVRTAGAFTLIFGLITVILSSVITLVVGLALAGQTHLSMLDQHVPMMSLLQLVGTQAIMMIWGVGGNDVIRLLVDGYGLGITVTVGSSWVLVLIAFFISIPAALYYAGGIGGAEKVPPTETRSLAQPATQTQPDVAVMPAGRV